LSFTCNYIYPRAEYFEARRLAESRRPLLIIGLKGSGVSTILSMISRLSKAQYEVLDLSSIREALETLKHSKAIVGATGSLKELLEVLIKPPPGLSIIVVRPLTFKEVEDYLSTLGVIVPDRMLLQELHYRSGGLPGEVCRLVVERGLFGKALSASDVNMLPSEPSWISEARDVMGSDFGKLMLHSLLAIIPKSLSSKIGVEGSWWLVDTGEDYRIPSDMLWLQGFALRLVDRSEVTKLLEEALAVDRDSFSRYIHSMTLYRLTGLREHARITVESALTTIDNTQDPFIKYDIALSTLELAEFIEPPETYIRLLTTLLENAPLTLPIEAGELAVLLSKAKRRALSRDALKAYVDLLHIIGLRLSTQRLLRELEMVSSELEDIAMRLDIPGDLRRRAEITYLKIQAVKSANLGQWRETLRLTTEALERGSSDSQLLSLLSLSLCFTGLEDPISLRALKVLSTKSGEDRRFEVLLKFCSANSIEDMNAIARVKHENEEDLWLRLLRLLALIASRTSITEDYIEKEVGQGPPQALIKAFHAVVKGDMNRVINLLREIPEAENPSNPLSLIADILVNISSAIRRSSDMRRLAPHIALLADSLKAGRQEELSRIVNSIAVALKEGDSDSLRVKLAKLIFYTLNTYL